MKVSKCVPGTKVYLKGYPYYKGIIVPNIPYKIPGGTIVTSTFGVTLMTKTDHGHLKRYNESMSSNKQYKKDRFYLKIDPALLKRDKR